MQTGRGDTWERERERERERESAKCVLCGEADLLARPDEPISIVEKDLVFGRSRSSEAAAPRRRDENNSEQQHKRRRH
eukprot:SAG11_NODE_18355_length_493_cov_1.159898_2_plen_77_part_01